MSLISSDKVPMVKLLSGNSVMWEPSSMFDSSPPQKVPRKERRSFGSIPYDTKTYQWFLVTHHSFIGLRNSHGNQQRKLSLLSVWTTPIDHSEHSCCQSVCNSATIRCVLFPSIVESLQGMGRWRPKRTVTKWQHVGYQQKWSQRGWKIAWLVKCLQTCTASPETSRTGYGGTCVQPNLDTPERGKQQGEKPRVNLGYRGTCSPN